MLQHIKRILSYLFVIPEHRFESSYSGEMDIRWERGRLVLNSPNANYSFNRLHRVFQSAFRTLDKVSISESPILNLGMAAGSTVSILRNELGIGNRIDSIEYDPKIIEIARKYFRIETLSNHQIIQDDAIHFLERTGEKYGLIIVDLFVDRVIPERFISQIFFDLLDSRLLENGQLMFNFLGDEEHPFEQFIPDHFDSLTIEDKANQVLIYRKTERS